MHSIKKVESLPIITNQWTDSDKAFKLKINMLNINIFHASKTLSYTYTNKYIHINMPIIIQWTDSDKAFKVKTSKNMSFKNTCISDSSKHSVT